MWNNVSDFEVRIKGHSLVQVNKGEVKINGKDFHRDLRNLTELVGILSDVLEQAEAMKRPRLVCDAGPDDGGDNNHTAREVA